MLDVFSKRSAVVDGSVSMYYKVKNGKYMPMDGETLIVVELPQKTDVKFQRDESSFDGVIRVIIVPVHGYVGFEDEMGNIRTYGIDEKEAGDLSRKHVKRP